MLRFGGEEALTKHEQAEAALKCQLDVEQSSKVDLGSVGKMLESNVFAIRSLEIVPCQVLKHEDATVVNASLKADKLGKVGTKLYDLEPACDREKPLKIDLDLYQMEDV